MNLALIGPSGVGKGTQIKRLVTAFGMHHFSPGNLFREAVNNRTPMGLAAKKYVETGDLVPDDIVNGILEEWLWSTHPKSSILFDGYPRTPLQATFLDEMLQELERKLDAVIYLHASESILIERLAGRRLCRVCPSEFHETHAPFQSCPYKRCRGEYLYQQSEDKPAVVSTRLEVFRRAIKPLLKHYENRANLIQINGENTPDQVHADLIAAIERIQSD